jgi:AbrB family looped-hinge helix DNA binding protein
MDFGLAVLHVKAYNSLQLDRFNKVVCIAMKQIITTVTRGGQVTLPAEVRRMLGVKPLDKVAFTIEDKEVRLVPVEYTVESAAGSVSPSARTSEVEERIEEAKEELAASLVEKLNAQ